MQTTLSADEAGGVLDAILDRFPAARGPGSDEICYATTNRQRAVRAIAADSDLALVVGSANSSNSLPLVDTPPRGGTPACVTDRAAATESGRRTAAPEAGIAPRARAPPSSAGP